MRDTLTFVYPTGPIYLSVLLALYRILIIRRTITHKNQHINMNMSIPHKTTRQTVRLHMPPLGALRSWCKPLWFPPAISKHTASLLPCKGGYPQLQGRGYHSFPQSSGHISISHLGVSHGHRNVPHTSHCLPKATPDSSALRPPGLYSSTMDPS